MVNPLRAAIAAAVLNILTLGLDVTNVSEPPIAMDIEWVMQGHLFGFQGFFVEFLGMSSGIRKLMPMTRLVQSSFKNSFNDSPVSNPEKFFKVDMFPQEGEDTMWLHNILHPPIEGLSSVRQPLNTVLRKPEPAESITVEALCDNDESHFIEGALVGGELSKYLLPEISSATECCRACFRQPACVSWTFAVEDGADGCRLKGAAPISMAPITSARSGLMIGSVSRGRSALPRAIILHGTTCVYRNTTIVRTDPNTIVIGRYMLERAIFRGGVNKDEYAVTSCATRVDEIWVPTEWHKAVFTDILSGMGFPVKSIAVIPESVDVTQFDPSKAQRRHEKWTTGLAGLQPIGGGVNGSESCLDDGSSSSKGSTVTSDACNNSAATVSRTDTQTDARTDTQTHAHTDTQTHARTGVTERRFEFLSVFKWERRKGWDVLLDAYWRAFQPTDAVTLRLRTYVPDFAAHLYGGETNVTELIVKYARETLGKELRELPRVVWETGDGPEVG